MTGAEHYLEAERLIAAQMTNVENFTRAQVHATLALAAATALQVPGGDDSGMYVADVDAWEKAASAQQHPTVDTEEAA